MFPVSQGQLLRLVRGERSQKEFAQQLGVARATLSRYENEKLGLPVHALNKCLAELAKLRSDESDPATELATTLSHAARLLKQIRPGQ